MRREKLAITIIVKIIIKTSQVINKLVIINGRAHINNNFIIPT